MIFSFTFYIEVFFTLSLARLLSDLTVYVSNTGVCLIRGRNYLHSRASEFTPGVMVESDCSSFYYFLRCPIMWLYVLCCDIPYGFCMETMFGSSLPPVVCSLIYVICLCFRLVMSNTYCVVFLLCFSSFCTPYVASFSGLSFFDCGIL
jgi:hypothetical protein